MCKGPLLWECLDRFRCTCTYHCSIFHNVQYDLNIQYCILHNLQLLRSTFLYIVCQILPCICGRNRWVFGLFRLINNDFHHWNFFLKFGLYSISFYPRFGSDRFHCNQISRIILDVMLSKC
jgi:hypothetical protein